MLFILTPSFRMDRIGTHRKSGRTRLLILELSARLYTRRSTASSFSMSSSVL